MNHKTLMRRLFVTMLLAKNKMYHFDDDAHDIVEIDTDRRVFTHEEAEFMNKMRDYLYDEELFEIAIELSA